MDPVIRHLKSPIIRQRELLNLFKNQKKATLVNGHGETIGPEKTVPSGVAILFLSDIGKCMDIESGIGIHNKFFTSKQKFKNFLTGGRGPRNNKHFHHVTDILSKAKLPNNKYLNMTIDITPNKKYKSMGHIRRLPVRPISHVVTLKNLSNNNLTVGKKILSNIIEKHGKGVYVISACRSIPNNQNSRMILNAAPGLFANPVLRLKRGTPLVLGTNIVQLPRKGARPGIMLKPKGNFKRSIVNNRKGTKKAYNVRNNMMKGKKGLLGNIPTSAMRTNPKLLRQLQQINSAKKPVSVLQLRTKLIPRISY